MRLEFLVFKSGSSNQVKSLFLANKTFTGVPWNLYETFNEKSLMIIYVIYNQFCPKFQRNYIFNKKFLNQENKRHSILSDLSVMYNLYIKVLHNCIY